LYEDSKVHFFGNWFDVYSADTTEHKVNDKDATTWYDYNDYLEQISAYTDHASACTIMDESFDESEGKFVCSGMTPDGVTSQIVNTKVIDITINILAQNKCQDEENQLLTKDAMEEIKYYQDVVMPYVAQMIPSTAILRVNYKLKDECNVIIIVN